MSIDDLLQLEKEYRKKGKWLFFSEIITNDHGINVPVQLKSFGFYNQIFKINNLPTDYASSHTINKVKIMHEHIRKTINLVKEN